MESMKQDGREKMRRAEIAMRAGRAEQELRQRLAVAKTRQDIEGIRSDALDYLTIFPDATARFRRLIEQIDHQGGSAPATPSKKVRKIKDTRPRWKREHREKYNIKLHELLAKNMSDREAARAAIAWAAENKELAQYRTPSASSLEKWAAAERKLMACRRKRR